MATLYVNPDHAGADDAGDYTAAQNSSTPLETIARGLNLAQLGDTVNVLYAAAANPDDPHGETDVYAGPTDDTFGGAWSNANKDASSGRITLQGVSVGGKQPKFVGMQVRSLKNWKVDNFQIGYDLGSGFEFDTAGGFIGLTDTLFSNCFYTGGGANILGFHGHCIWQGCEVVSKIRPTPTSFMEGAGFRVLCHYASDETAGPDDWVEFHGCNFHTIQGEDGVQLLGSIGVGNALVEDCEFNDMPQSTSAHTDGIQTTGLQALIVRRCTFGVDSEVASMIIGSDSTTVTTLDTLVLENNLFAAGPGTGFSTQFGGVNNITVRHNTWAKSNFGGLHFYGHSEFPDTVEIVNNLIDKFTVVDTPTWDQTDQHHNVISQGFATSGDFVAIPEFGVSDDTGYELANSPVATAGVDQGVTSDITTDRLGRAREGSAPDCGCHESNPAVLVVAAPRAPFLVSTSPVGGASGVGAGAGVSATFYPKPGETLDPASVDDSSFFVRDAASFHIPGVVTLGEIDEDGRQTVTIDLKQSLDPLEDGDLFPLVGYTAVLTADIQDSEGSAFDGASWGFTVAGTGGPAIGTGTGPVVEPPTFTIGSTPWPAGTTVRVYPAVAFPAGANAPSGPQVTSGVVSSGSTVTFDDLDNGIRYVAFALGIGVRFMVPLPVFKTVRVS